MESGDDLHCTSLPEDPKLKGDALIDSSRICLAKDQLSIW